MWVHSFPVSQQQSRQEEARSTPTSTDFAGPWGSRKLSLGTHPAAAPALEIVSVLNQDNFFIEQVFYF